MINKRNRKLVLGGLTASLLVIAAVLYYQNHRYHITAANKDQSTDTAQSLPAPQGGQSVPSGDTDKNQSSVNSPSPQTSSFSLTLVRAGQLQTGGSVQIRALVDGVTSGSCQVTFSGGGTTFSKSSNISYDGRTYSCGALDAEASQFSQGGTWEYSLKATSGSGNSNIINGQVTVTK